MAGPLDELTALLPPSARGNVSAPMPGPMAQPQSQLAMMPNLPTQATPMRQADPSGHTTHIPWAELLQTIAPVMGSLASGDSKGGFMQGYGHGQQMAQQEQEKRKTQQAQKTQQAEQFRMEIFQAAREITDPQEWAQFVNLATESAMHMGMIKDPSEIKQFLTYPAHLEKARKQKELLDKLGEVMKRPDFQDLMDHGASITLKDGTRYKLQEAVTIAGALPEINGKPVAPPTTKTTPPSDYEQSFARYLTGIGKTPQTATSADEFAFKRLTRDATTRPTGGSNNTPGGGLTDEGSDYAATVFRVTGKMPSLGNGGQAAKAAIINKAAAQAKLLGQSPAASIQKQAAYKADGAALTKITTMAAAAESFETKALAQAEIVADLSKKVNRTQYPIINQALLSGQAHIVGDANTQLLFNAIATFTAEYAKIMEGSTGSAAGSSDSSRRQAAELISAALNKGQLQATIELMKREMALTIDGYDATKQHITERMGGVVPQQAPAQAAPARIYYDSNGNVRK